MTAARGQAPRVPFGNMRFRVEIEDLPGGGAVEVIFPEARIDTKARKSGAVRYGALVIRRGLTLSREWYEWWDTARRGKRPPKRSVRVTLRDGNGVDAAGWLFKNALPVAYQLSPLNSLGNEPVIETLEMSVGGFEAVYSGRANANRTKGRRRPRKK